MFRFNCRQYYIVYMLYYRFSYDVTSTFPFRQIYLITSNSFEISSTYMHSNKEFFHEQSVKTCIKLSRKLYNIYYFKWCYGCCMLYFVTFIYCAYNRFWVKKITFVWTHKCDIWIGLFKFATWFMLNCKLIASLRIQCVAHAHT